MNEKCGNYFAALPLLHVLLILHMSKRLVKDALSLLDNAVYLTMVISFVKDTNLKCHPIPHKCIFLSIHMQCLALRTNLCFYCHH